MKDNLNINDHFSQVASSYRQFRTTDEEVILFISKILKDFPKLKAADIGCGTGRYDLLLFQHLNNLHLTCIDANESMLRQASNYLTRHNILQFELIQADGNNIPLEDNSMNCIFTFNAIHHFDFIKFVENAARIIKANGKIFIYTRLRSQNAKSIWGQYFPLFTEKESRLYEMNEIEEWIKSINGLHLDIVKFFQYQRESTLEQCIEKVHARHYSTFFLYSEEELNDALDIFQTNFKSASQNTIEWIDENLLLVLSSTTE